jgi:2-polyprenyl-3-methyl-5-hydroxy-6-metoxy-1,4-benzoquinol methylase
VTKSLQQLYEARFDEEEVKRNDALWREIVRFLGRYIDADAPVLDIGCGVGHFIRWVDARERWASDIRDMRYALTDDIRFVQASGLDLADTLSGERFGTIFMSNYLEHLESSDAVIDQLRVAGGLLRPGGRVIVLQPNIRLVGSRYWDFIDHKVPLTERSLLEAAELAGLGTVELVTRFLPYSTKGRLPTAPSLVRGYLAFRPAWWLLGKQTLYVGERAG